MQDKYSLETQDADKSKRQIASAVRYYSRYNPYIVLYEFTTTIDVSAYDLPAGATIIVDVLWPADEALTVINVGAVREAMLRRPVRYDLVAERVIEDIKSNAFYDHLLGNWRRQNDQVVLVPTPGVTGQDVQLWYGQDHAINAGATGYDTIPAADMDILADLALVEVLLQKQIETATEPNYREGLGSLTKHHVPTNIARAIKDLRKGVRGKYGGSVVG